MTFPLAQLPPNKIIHAQSNTCVNKIGGNKMNKILNLVGPTATPSEHKVLTMNSGNKAVEDLKAEYVKKIEQQHLNHRFDLSKLDTLVEREEQAFKEMNARGLMLDMDAFEHQMNSLIEELKSIDDNSTAEIQAKRLNRTKYEHPKSTVIHPTFSSTSSRTRRITVSRPALQNWKSSVRIALSPPVSGYEHRFSIDCKAYDPTVLAVLSKDEYLMQDLSSDDFYHQLLELVDVNEKSSANRQIIKSMFLACFINGADVDYHLRKTNAPFGMAEWQVIENRYDKASQYRKDIETNRQAESLNGITYSFKKDDTAVFAKFIQHEAAYIFRHMFIEVFRHEKELQLFTLLPIHDEILVALKSPELINQVEKLMIDTFSLITGSNQLKVEVNKFGGPTHE